MRYSPLGAAHRVPLLVSSAAAVALLAACTGEPPTEAESPSFAAAANSWTTRAPMPLALREHTASVLTNAAGEQIVYVIGGYNTEKKVVNGVYAYNPNTNTWTTKRPIQSRRRQTNGAVTIKGRIYVTGGQWGGGVFRELVVYNPGTNTWNLESVMPNPVRWGVSANLGNKLYVLYGECTDCGATPGFVRQLWRYDPAAFQWTRMSDPPRLHAQGVGGVINGKWYVAGGVADQALDVYDPQTNTWVSKASIPSGHKLAAGAVLGKKLYVIGGSPNQQDVHAYDPVTNTWTTKAPLPTPRKQLVAVKSVRNGNAVIYALGGQNSLLSSLSKNEEYDD
jgi:N-acetylneuraminic acid mutarotase